MKLEKYIHRVKYTKRKVFCKLSITDDFDWNELFQLCDLNIPKDRLYTAWSLLLGKISDANLDNKIPEEVLNFLIENSICLTDIGHLCIADRFLRKVYEKDQNCWEAKRD